MLTVERGNIQTVERERERESNNTKNVATKVAYVFMLKNNINMYEIDKVSYV